MKRLAPIIRTSTHFHRYPSIGLLLALVASAFILTTFAGPLPTFVNFQANHPPDTPVVNEPFENQLANPGDVHMETTPFSDPDSGDKHRCSDWEIWVLTPVLDRVWASACITGLEKIHMHLGDGNFINSYAGRLELMHDTFYVMRVRHRDDSGNPATEWSAWRERSFTTGPPAEIFPLAVADILASPQPIWQDEMGNEIVLPSNGSPSPLVQIGSPTGALVLEIRNEGGASNTFIDKPALPEHTPIALLVVAGNTGVDLALPESRLMFTADSGDIHTIYLPGMRIASNDQSMFWISRNGSTYAGDITQTEPDFTQLARGAPVPWEVKQPGYEVEIVATGFQLPVNIAFVPQPGEEPDDPFYYVTELYGIVKVVTRDGTVRDYATDLLNFNPTGKFPGSGEQGLSGIVIEPNTGDVLVSMLYDAAPPSGPHYPKVVRFHSNDGGLTAASQTTVIDMHGELQGGSHFISNLSFDQQGKLYVHVGDGNDPSTARNLNSYRGKILRMNLDGTAPSDNPFYNSSDGITALDYIYASGFRNPFGGAWRAADGYLYEVENGPSTDRFARVIPGNDYGWTGDDDDMLTDAIYNWFPPVAPVNIVFIQPHIFAGSGFPTNKMDHAFVTEAGKSWVTGPLDRGKCITEFELDAAGNWRSGPTTLIKYTGSGKAAAVGLAAGPDGLYFSDLHKDLDYLSPIDRGANILRIKYVGVVDFLTVNQLDSLTVQFVDHTTLTSVDEWFWRFDDGTSSHEQNPLHTFSTPGNYNIRLQVTGGEGTRILQRKIKVANFKTILFMPLVHGTGKVPGSEC